MPAELVVPRAPRRPEDAAVIRALRRTRRLYQELAVRGSIAILILAFNEGFSLGAGAGADPVIRAAALAGLLVNGPYYLAGRTDLAPRLQACTRMLADVGLLTLGLYGAGGLAAGPYLGVYALVAVYAGIAFSSRACLVATWAATAAFLALALLQEAGWLSTVASPPPNAWGVAAFNLLILNLVGGLTALLAVAYRRSQLRLGTLYQHLEVSDTGPGLKPDVFPRVFEPFFTTKPEGTGLGLAISAGIVRDLGGELTAGNGPEGGAVFRVSLPALPRESARSA